MTARRIERLRPLLGGRTDQAETALPNRDREPESDQLGRLESRLVWMWGSPRSGSTWLLQLLSHPLDPDPEEVLGFRVPAADRDRSFDSVPVDETFISNHLAPALADPRMVEGRWVPGTINNLLAGKPAYAFSDAYRHAWEPAVKQFALHRLQAVVEQARAEGLKLEPDHRVVIKETNGSHAADLVMRVLPASRLLLLIRDGRDVVDSLLHAYQPGGFMANKQGRSFATPEQRAEGLGWAARLWACNTDMTLKAMESHPAELTRVVRYEDLLDDGAAQVKGLYEWLGLPREDAWVEDLLQARSFDRLPQEQVGPKTRNRSARPGLWRENLTREEQRRVDEICGPLLERFGYER